MVMVDEHSVVERLLAAGVEPGTDPLVAWRRLHEHEGPRATVIDLYALAAEPRGLTAQELPLHERLALARAAMPDVWPGFSLTAGSERAGEMIRIVDHDAGWAQTYERWREVLRACLGDAALRIEHVGSTSVAGLPAKPIVDIQVSVADLADEPRYVPALEGTGLQLRSKDDLHRYFRPFRGRPRDVHVHVCTADSDWEREHLLFRDYLRSAPPACEAYADAKRRAAAVWADDGIAYTDGKRRVILSLLQKAQEALVNGR